jgi:adenine-specific DNA glycosylase
MDLGATVCLPNGTPHCDICPWKDVCTAYKDDRIDALPVKKEVKATVSGIYIIDVKALHGKIESAPPKKKTLRTKLLEKRDSLMKKTTSSK